MIRERIQAYVRAGEGVPQVNPASSFPVESASAVATELGTEQDDSEFAIPAAPFRKGSSGEVHYFEHSSGQVAGVKFFPSWKKL